MPVTITPSAPSLYAQSLTAPADGDLANAASVNNAFQAIMDAAEVARLVLYGARLKSRYYCVFPNNGPPPNGPLIAVRPMGQIFLTNAGNWITYWVNATLQVNAVTSHGGIALAAKTRYYVYYCTNAGLLDAVVVTNPPHDDLRYGAGPNTDFVYIGTFLTSAVASNVWTFNQDNGYYRYDGNFDVLSAGQANAWTAFDPYNTAGDGNVVPPYARTLHFQVRAVNSAGAADTLAFAPMTAFGGGPSYVVPAGGTVNAEFSMNIEGGYGSSAYYKWTTGGGTTSATCSLIGWEEAG